VIAKEGGGNFAVSARENWYPAASAFRDRATYDITFHVPKGLTAGERRQPFRRETRRRRTVTEWKSDEPLLVAGFNYGEFKKRERVDDATKTKTGSLRHHRAAGFVESRFARNDAGAIGDGGPGSGGRAQRGASVHGMVRSDALRATRGDAAAGFQLRPIVAHAHLPAHQRVSRPHTRWQLLGDQTFRFSKEFINVVTAHEVAHQWWGTRWVGPVTTTTGCRKASPISPPGCSSRPRNRRRRCAGSSGTASSACSRKEFIRQIAPTT